MKTFKYITIAVIISLSGILLASFFDTTALPVKEMKFPYKRGGLTERQAAAHLLDRFSYGATPGQVDQVVSMGLEKWFEQQLTAGLPDDSLNNKLSKYDALNLSNTEVEQKFPPGFVVRQYAIRDSAINKDSVDKAVNKKAFNDTLNAYMARKGYRPEQELYKQFISQKILRAAYTNNQLQEVLTDFWFNHFNVSLTKGECAAFIPAYERDVIRPNVLGKFDKMLIAEAQSPAMLYYLDNFASVGPPAAAKPNNKPVVVKPADNGNTMMGDGMQSAAAKPATAKPEQSMMMMDAAPKKQAPTVKTITPQKNVTGLNENFAREVMELHTLGVDGGYTQTDVTQAARVLTGWTIYPIAADGYGAAMKGLVNRIGVSNLEQKGFVHIGDFLFTPTRHDMGEKIVLGHHFDANGGYQEGVDLLEMLAHHPSTAKFICKKLAVRFVSDHPSPALIAKMAKTFTEQDGDIKQVIITMVSSPEFWKKDAVREKTKSPFELAISSIRGLNASITDPYQVYNWVNRMGEKMYYYQAPTGFPDRGNYWINTGSLLNRMNFGLALASQKIPGVTVNLAALNNHHEPESAQAALLTYSKLVMPERDLDKTIQRLAPLLNDPQLVAKINNAANKVPAPQPANLTPVQDMATMTNNQGASKPQAAPKVNMQTSNTPNANMLAQVVGIIIGSPEFQRR
ncbi:DUF1800 domain-containing protein [Mucilaginibacter sp. HMF5004]|uniref:DUF1800 domain-containing protein n=1 Tax=Mucilaginibacter rivuli TaxID=2857527 RepID=UPI001C5D37A8|nr:DUF1800 domain-containing protein [Mucilaginibacter rivuli]MBW4891491.1 DUF1800 domain-containing protein [Mucilaginibacter rivuli]